MLEIIKKNKQISNEDTFFAYYADINKPCSKSSQEFSIETTFYDKSFGIHKIWCYLPNDKINQLIVIYPDIKILIELQ